MSEQEKIELLTSALEKDVQRIEQLCNMVNQYADKLGLGRKVYTEDFTENAIDALAKINQ